MTYEELAKRRSEDFKFLVVCHSKGNPGMYSMLRDRTIDPYKGVEIKAEQDMKQEVEVTA